MIRLLAMALLLITGAPRGERSLTIPPDRSLTVAAYVDLGMPDPSQEWGPEEARKAWEVLRSIYQDDPSKLPRHRSGRSGPLFDKLLTESLAFDTIVGDLPAAELEATVDTDFESIADRSLTSVYRLRPESGLLFDREVVAILGHLVDQTVSMWIESRESAAEIERLVTSLRAAGRDADAEHARELQDVRVAGEAGLETVLLQQLQELALAPSVEMSPQARDEAIWHLRNAYDRCSGLFSVEGAEHAKEILAAAGALSEARAPAARQDAATRDGRTP